MRVTMPTADHRGVRGRLTRWWRVLLPAFVVVAAASAGSVIAGEAPASAIGNGRISLAPTTSGGHARQVFTPVLTAGGTATDEVSVANLTTHQINVQLYAADAYNSPTGSFAIKPDFEPKVHMGKWIHLAVPSLTLPPLSGDLVPFTYEVPGNVAPGDYAGGIVAVQTTGAPINHGHVRFRAEYAIGVPVLGSIPGTLNPRLEVSAVSVTTTRPFASQFGGPVDAKVTYSVTNAGNEDLKPTITVSLSPLIGGGATFQQKLPAALLPGSTVTFHHTFDSVAPFGSLTATVTAQTHVTEATGSSTAIVIPWGIVVIVVLLIVLVVLFVRRRRRSRPGPSSDLAQAGGAPHKPGGSTRTTSRAPKTKVGGGPGARAP